MLAFFFQAEDGIRDLVRSRGLGDVYKRQDGDRDLGASELVAADELQGGGGHRQERGDAKQELSLIHI